MTESESEGIPKVSLARDLLGFRSSERAFKRSSNQSDARTTWISMPKKFAISSAWSFWRTAGASARKFHASLSCLKVAETSGCFSTKLLSTSELSSKAKPRGFNTNSSVKVRTDDICNGIKTISFSMYETNNIIEILSKYMIVW